MNDCIWDRNFYEKINNFSNDINVNNAFRIGLFSYTSAGPYPHTYWYGKDELKVKSDNHKDKFLEHYNRQLTSRDVEKYIEGEQDVVDLTHLINEFALLRNKYIGLTKALDAKQFQLNNIIKLRAAGLEALGL